MLSRCLLCLGRLANRITPEDIRVAVHRPLPYRHRPRTTPPKKIRNLAHHPAHHRATSTRTSTSTSTTISTSTLFPSTDIDPDHSLLLLHLSSPSPYPRKRRLRYLCSLPQGPRNDRRPFRSDLVAASPPVSSPGAKLEFCRRLAQQSRCDRGETRPPPAYQRLLAFIVADANPNALPRRSPPRLSSLHNREALRSAQHPEAPRHSTRAHAFAYAYAYAPAHIHREHPLTLTRPP